MPKVRPNVRGGRGGLSFTLKDANLRKAVKNLRTNLKSKRTPLTEIARDYMAKTVIKNRFTSQGIPKWRSLKPSTIRRRRFKSKPILQQTGTLKGSATGGALWQMEFLPSRNPDTVNFGSNVSYAGEHDRPRGEINAKNIPGRPWSYWTQANVNRSMEIFIKWTRVQVKKSGLN